MPHAQPPVLSFTERDRRWVAVRALMGEHKLDCLVAAGFRAREMYESYISDDYNEQCTVLPLEGDPVVLTWANLRVLRAKWSEERGHALWVNDYRVATNGAQAAEVVREKLGGGSRLGLVDECRTAAMGMLARGDWVRPERLAAVFGVDGPPALDEALAEGARSGTLEGRAGRVRIAPGAAPSARSTTLRALLPRPRSDAAREAAERSAAAADREDVQPDLIEVDALVRRAVSATDPQVAVAQPGSRGRP